MFYPKRKSTSQRSDVSFVATQQNVSANAIPPALAGIQIGLAAALVNGRIFLDHKKPVAHNFRLPGGTTANYARPTAGRVGWNIDMDYVLAGDPVESLLRAQEKMESGEAVAYSYAEVAATKGPQHIAFVANIVFADDAVAGAFRDFKNLTNAPIAKTVFSVEFGNEWYSPLVRSRVGFDVLVERAEDLRKRIERFCIETGKPIPIFVYPYPLHTERGDSFQAYVEAITPFLKPGDAVAIHDYFIDHWKGGRLQSARTTLDVAALFRAVQEYTFDDFARRMDRVLVELPSGVALAVTEWAVRGRGEGWKGTIAEIAFSAKYISYLIRYESARPGSIALANFQNLFSDKYGPGIWTPNGSGYEIDGTGIVLNAIFGWIAPGNTYFASDNLVKLADSPGFTELVKVGDVCYSILVNDKNAKLFIGVNLSGVDQVFDLGDAGSALQIYGDNPSDRVGPDLGVIDTQGLPTHTARVEVGSHDGKFVLRSLGIAVATF